MSLFLLGVLAGILRGGVFLWAFVGPVDHVKHRLFSEMVLAPGKTLC